VQGQKLQQQEAEFNNFANQKNNEIIEEQTVMMNQLADAIKTYLDKYNEEKQYAMILTNQGGAPVITGDPGLDITDEVLAGLNEEYVKNKNNN
jgi:outer membrane protein